MSPVGELVRSRRKVRSKEAVLRPLRTPKNLTADLLKIGLQVARAWEAAFAETILPQMERDGFVTDDMSGLEGAFRREGEKVSSLVATLVPGIERWALRIERWHRVRFGAALKGATREKSVEAFVVPLDRSDAVQARTKEAAALIRSISDDARQRIERLTYEAVANSRPRRALAKDVADVIGASKTRARTIANDQTVKLSKRLDIMRAEEALGADANFRWVHSGKVNGREDHIAREGKKYSLQTNPPPTMPGEEVNCACTFEWVINYQ